MPEEHEQAALVAWARHEAHIDDRLWMLFSIPNQGPGRRSAAYRASLIRQGMAPGVPDLFLAAPVPPYAGLFIEMKWGRAKPRPNQVEWIERLRAYGYCVVVCWSFEEARDAIQTYLKEELK